MQVKAIDLEISGLKDVVRLCREFDTVYLADSNVGRKNAERLKNLVVFDHHGEYQQKSTATEQCLNFLKSRGAKAIFKGNNVVCTDNFDADALLAVFTLASPSTALRHERLLRAAAVFGDFTVFSGDYAIKARVERKLYYVLMNWLNEAFKQKKLETLAQKTFFLNASVKKLARVLENIEAFSRDYLTGLKAVERTVTLARRRLHKESRVLSVLDLKRPLHKNFAVVGVAVYAASKTPIVLRREGGKGGSKYVIGIKTSKENKRFDLTPVIERLQKLEKHPGVKWFGRRDVAISSGNSSISLERVKAEVTSLIKEAVKI